MIRQVSDYKCILREVQMRKRTATEVESARLLCLNLMKREIPKDELAQQNITGNSRDHNKKKGRIPKIDSEILHSIFGQAKLQFPGFNEWYTDHKCKTVEMLNDGCKRARREVKKGSST